MAGHLTSCSATVALSSDGFLQTGHLASCSKTVPAGSNTLADWGAADGSYWTGLSKINELTLMI